MSLLEDVFLEDEAGEAQELERVIEGDEFDERPRTPNSDENSEKDDEAEEDKRRVDHTAKAKRVVKNPRFVLNPARLTGPRGIQIIPEHFKDFKFKGKGHEREDLDMVLKKLEHWAYRLYPKFKFDDCLKKIETLGKKRPVAVHLHKIRTDQFMSEETIVQKDSSEDEAETAPVQEEDEFDRLLQQQIELARSTPAPGSIRKEAYTPITPVANGSPLLAPKISSSPSISDEQKERMIRNRKLAEERRLAKLNQVNNTSVSNVGNHSTSTEASVQKNDTDKTNDKVNDSIADDVYKDDNEVTVRKHNRSNVIDSSDDDDDVMAVNKSITVDVHDTVQENDEKTNDKANDFIAVDVDTDDNEVTVRKHLRSNVIDSSDEDDDVMAVNESITVDVHDTVQENDAEKINDKVNNSIAVDVDTDDNEVTVRKHLRSNVIDSSDEDDDVMAVNESITVDVHDTVQENDAEKINDKVNNSIAVDVDTDYNELTVRKHLRSNVIDSSDEDDDVMAVNESITVDVHDTVQENDAEKINDKVNNSIAVDVDTDDNEVTVRKHHRSNVIDSSDEDDGVMAVNESITVDVHDTVNNVGHDIGSDKKNSAINVKTTSEYTEERVNSIDAVIEMNKEPSESMTDAVTEVVLNENKTKETFSDTVTLDNDTNSQNVQVESLNFENNNKNNLICAEIPILPDDKHNDEASTNEKGKRLTLDESPQTEKDLGNVKVPETEDLMDVDFTDDF